MAAKRPVPRLAMLTDEQMNAPQRALIDALRAGPRGKSISIRGPFAAWLHAPVLGDLAQKLGAHVRYGTSLSPRQSEFAILCTARLWRAQYEWFAHAPMAEKAGVSLKTIADLRAGRVPNKAQKDERAIYDFIKELYRSKRVSERTYARVRGFLHNAGMVELVGILGYYVLISMTLNVFQMMPPANAELAFAESNAR
jgi:4-carboxymuconolactone decarboxylase